MDRLIESDETYRRGVIPKSAPQRVVFSFVNGYPNAFKPYYDAQFVELLEQGYDVKIFASGMVSRTWSRFVNDYRLLERTDRILAGGAQGVRNAGTAAVANIFTSPKVLNRLPRARPRTRSLGNRLRQTLQILALPVEPPLLCLVQADESLRRVPWLRAVYPETPVAMYYYGGLPAEAGVLDRTALKRNLQIPDAIFALTEFARSEIVALGAPPEKTHVLPLGFHLQSFDKFDGVTPSRPGRLKTVMIGRLSEGKGHEIALRALASSGHDDISLEIIGAGPLLGQVEAAIRELGLRGRVSLSGPLPYEEALNRMAQADLLLLPSVPTATWSETQGAVMQEALLTGTLVVASRTGGIPESLPPFMHPYLVPPANVRALAGALDRVYRMPAAEASEIVAQGRLWVRRKYDNSQIMHALVETTVESRQVQSPINSD